MITLLDYYYLKKILKTFQELLLGDATKAKTILGWSPKVNFEVSIKIVSFLAVSIIISFVFFQQLVHDMMEADLELMKKNPSA